MISLTSCIYKRYKASYFSIECILCRNTIIKRRNPYKGTLGRKNILVKKAYELS
jgi:hypothetical protein